METKSGISPSLLVNLEQSSCAIAHEDDVLLMARAFAAPLLGNSHFNSGENILSHTDAMVKILQSMGASQTLQVTCYLAYVIDHLNKPHEAIAKAFGQALADLAQEANKLIRVQRMSQLGSAANQSLADHAENIRKLMLAFAQDVRVVLLRLTSRLQTLRYFVKSKNTPPVALIDESLQVYAPLANRLGIWEIKWEIEDLAFRFSEPLVYKEVATLLDEKRIEREQYIAQFRHDLEVGLQKIGMHPQVMGRPKHIYSIVKKMRGKSLSFDALHDLRAFRIVLVSLEECYTALSWIHQQYNPIASEFDDYIVRPKPNGYQSLHTVIRDKNGCSVEIQIRTKEMHERAETGVAAHWVYKEAGVKGYQGVPANSAYDAKIAVLRQLISWGQDICTNRAVLNDRIYIFTPKARVIDLPVGATAIDFAYSLHTNLGHRCRGARIDGHLLPLNTRLKSGQTVDIIAAKEGGPSRDWLNPDLGFLASSRAKSKVRAWFNVLKIETTIAKGREIVEKLLQREGKTAVNLENLAQSQGFANAEKLFECVGKDEISLRRLELELRPQKPALGEPTPLMQLTSRLAVVNEKNKDTILVVGVGSLLTQLAKCCKPAPPDAICGFVTRGNGVSVHRTGCANFSNMVIRSGERVVDVDWGKNASKSDAKYTMDLIVKAIDRKNLIRDICDILAKEKINVVHAHTSVVKNLTHILLTIEASDTKMLAGPLTRLKSLTGVSEVRRR